MSDPCQNASDVEFAAMLGLAPADPWAALGLTPPTEAEPETIEGETLPAKWSPLQQALLDELSRHGRVARACKSVGVSYMYLYNMRRRDDAFDLACHEAVQVGLVSLEDAALERSVEGWEEPVFHMGMECGSKRKFSDSLTMFMLQGAFPEKYRARSEVNVNSNAPVATLVVPASTSVNDWLKEHNK